METRIPDHDGDTGSSLAKRLTGALHLPIYRSSSALILTTGFNALLGLLFWVAAARLYPADVVGLGAAGISALQLVACIGWVGLQFTLLRYVPVAGARSGRLVILTYASGIVAALVVAVLFTTGFADRLRVPYIVDGALPTVAFWISAAVWVVFSLQDAVLIGIHRAFVVPVENSVYGSIKLLALVVLSSVASPWTLLGVWAASTAAIVVVINGLLFTRFLAAKRTVSRLPGRRAIARFSTGHSAVALTAWVPDFLVPLLVLSYLNHAANAYYYAAWTVGFSTRLLSVNIADALTVEAAYAEGSVRALVRPVMRLCVVVVLPAMGVLLLAAPLILAIFGPRYSDAASPLLRLFAVGLVPYTVATLVIAYDRVRERFGAALVIAAVGTVTTISADIVLIPADGITGAGFGWLLGQTVAACTAIATVLRSGRLGVP